MLKLLKNLDKIHTTELGLERIKRNLGLTDVDVVVWCKDKGIYILSYTKLLDIGVAL